MTFIAIDIDAQRAISGLTALAQMRGLRRGLAGAAVHLQGKAATYPGERHAPQPFVSDAQRRGFFARLRSGEIQVPYVRGFAPTSEQLGQRWTVEERDGGLTQVIGNNASYARLVQGAGRQTYYHRVTGWKTDEQIMSEEAPRVYQIVNAEIAADVEAS